MKYKIMPVSAAFEMSLEEPVSPMSVFPAVLTALFGVTDFEALKTPEFTGKITEFKTAKCATEKRNVIHVIMAAGLSKTEQIEALQAVLAANKGTPAIQSAAKAHGDCTSAKACRIGR